MKDFRNSVAKYRATGRKVGTCAIVESVLKVASLHTDQSK